MATSRRRTYRKRGGRRRKTEWYNRKYNAMQIATKAAKGVWYLKGLVNSEMFKFDNSVGLQATNNSTGSTFSIVTPAEGDDYFNRTGNSIFVRSVYLRFFFNWNALGSADQWVNLYVVQDNQQIADTPPSMVDLIVAPGNITTGLNPNANGRFKVLKHDKFVVRSTTPQTKLIEYYMPMRHHVKFNGSASGDIQKGGLYFMVSTSATTNGPQYIANWRVSYHDN